MIDQQYINEVLLLIAEATQNELLLWGLEEDGSIRSGLFVQKKILLWDFKIEFMGQAIRIFFKPISSDSWGAIVGPYSGAIIERLMREINNQIDGVSTQYLGQLSIDLRTCLRGREQGSDENKEDGA